jgi:hypothetical protein
MVHSNYYLLLFKDYHFFIFLFFCFLSSRIFNGYIRISTRIRIPSPPLPFGRVVLVEQCYQVYLCNIATNFSLLHRQYNLSFNFQILEAFVCNVAFYFPSESFFSHCCFPEELYIQQQLIIENL